MQGDAGIVLEAGDAADQGGVLKFAILVIFALVSMVMCCAVSTASGNLKLLRQFEIVSRLVARCCGAQHSAAITC